MATTTLYETATLRVGGSAAGVAQVNLGDNAANAFRVLFTNGYTFVNEHSARAQVTANEVVGPNYVNNGLALANVTWVIDSSGTSRFDCDDLEVTASGGAITADGLILYKDNITGDPTILHIDTAGTAEAGDGTLFRVTMPAGGLIQLKPG